MTMLNNLRLWQKTLLPLVLSAAVTLGLSFFLLQKLGSVDERYSDMIDREAEAAAWTLRANVTLMDMARQMWRGIGDDGRDLTVDIRTIGALQGEFNERMEKVKAKLAGTPMAAGIPAMEQEFADLHKTAMTALQLKSEGKEAAAIALIRRDYTSLLAALRDKMRKLAQETSDATAARSDLISAQVEAVTVTAYVVVGVSVALVMALGVAIVLGGVVGPLGRLTATTGELAGGKLDSVVPGTARGDEIGGLARSIETFRQGLVAAEAAKAEVAAAEARSVQEKRAAMLQLADSFEASVGQVVATIASASGELTAASTSMASIAEETSRQAAAVSTASSEASGNVQTVASATEELSASVEEISRQVAKSTEIAMMAVDEAERSTASVQGLSQSAGSIGEVVQLISQIASQTNLLALNATIEAARAGDAGKGFAVVASEVKHLALQTARATEDIAGKISALQVATTDNVGAIERITKVIREMNGIAVTIAAAVEEQGAATQEIARSVQQAAEGTRAVTSNIAAVTQASAETGAAASQVQVTSEDLSRQSEGLRGEVNRFLDRVRAA